MFFNFLAELRTAGIAASMKEHLILLEALDMDLNRFARLTLTARRQG
jgi:uncharacterized protein